MIRRPQSLVSTVRRLFWFNFLLREPVFDLFPYFVLRLISFSTVASSPILISILIFVLFVLFVFVPSLFSFVHRDLSLFPFLPFYHLSPFTFLVSTISWSILHFLSLTSLLL